MKVRLFQDSAWFAAALVSCLMLAAAGPAHAYTISTTSGTPSLAAGQTLIPNTGATPDPGLGVDDTVYLTNVSFTSGGGGGHAETRLAILPLAFFEFAITGPQLPDPDWYYPLETAASNALALSTNTIDTTASADTVYSFDFAGVALDYDTPVSAVFVTVGSGGTVITPVGVSVTFVLFEETSPGVYEPTENHGGYDNFDEVSLFLDYDGNGYLDGGEHGYDLGFTATFAVPEPAGLGLLGVAGMTVLLRRGRALRRR